MRGGRVTESDRDKTKRGPRRFGWRLFFVLSASLIALAVPGLWLVHTALVSWNSAAPYTDADMTHFDGVHPKALKALDALRERSGRRWTVTSAKRPKKLNIKVGGASKSMHLSGRAFDLRVPHWARERFYEDAKAAGFKGFGWGEGQVHVDIRGRSEWWSYTGGTYIGAPKKWDHLYKAPATFIEEVSSKAPKSKRPAGVYSLKARTVHAFRTLKWDIYMCARDLGVID